MMDPMEALERHEADHENWAVSVSAMPTVRWRSESDDFEDCTGQPWVATQDDA